MADEFSNLGKDISKAIENVLSAKELQELKSTVQNTVNSAISGALDSTVQGINKGINKIHVKINQDGTVEKEVIERKPPAAPKARKYNYPVPVVVKNKPMSTLFSNLMIGLGTAGAVVMGGGLLSAVIFTLTSALPIYAAIPIGVLSGMLMTAGIVTANMGHRRKDMILRLDRYLRVIAGKTYCEIQALASAIKKPASFVVKDLKRMIAGGMISEGFFDERESTIILDYDTYQLYLAAEQKAYTKPEPQSDQAGGQDQAIDELDQIGRSFVLQIRQINDALPDPEISGKLDSLESITKKIFDYVGLHPEKKPQIRKFMRYYLPTTLKLMEAYLELDSHGSLAEVERTKEEISTALNNINRAFEKLFSSLLENDLLNVSADISALESMLAMEGLGDEEF